jgi:hypothetical protein
MAFSLLRKSHRHLWLRIFSAILPRLALIQINLFSSLFAAQSLGEYWAAMLLSGARSSFGGNQLVVRAL